MDIEIFNKAKSEDPERMKQYLNDNKKMLIEAVNSGRIDKDIGMILQWFDMYYGQQNSLEDILKSWGFTSLQVDALMAQYGSYCSCESINTVAVVDPIDYENAELPQISWAVKDLIPDGVSILAAPPKSYKSFFALQMSVAVCNGFDFLGFGTVKGDVIYFDLESSKRRPLNRILDMYSTLDISGLHLVTADSNVRRLFNGFEEDLQNLLFTYPNTRLVIIDVFQRILPVISKDNLYSSDYTNINGLNAIASKYAISILIIHHTRKHRDNTDPVNNISGSTGLSGAANSILQIAKTDRSSTTAHLLATGNDIAPKDIVIRFDEASFHWRNEGTAEQVALREFANSPDVQAVFALMNSRQEWSGTVSDIVLFAKDIGITLDPAHLGRVLSIKKDSLNRLGLSIERSRTGASRLVAIKKILPDLAH